MQVRSIKAEFSPSIGIYITADCLIGKMNREKGTRGSGTGNISLEINTQLDLPTKELGKQLQCTDAEKPFKKMQNRSFHHLLEYLRLKMRD